MRDISRGGGAAHGPEFGFAAGEFGTDRHFRHEALARAFSRLHRRQISGNQFGSVILGNERERRRRQAGELESGGEEEQMRLQASSLLRWLAPCTAERLTKF